MAGKSRIEWCTDSWNPIVGCSLASPGCTNCYAMRQAHRIQRMTPGGHYAGTTREVNGNPVWTGAVFSAPEYILTVPLRWKKPRRIFVNSMSDLFHEHVRDSVIDKVFAVMALCPQHTFQVLTKRPARMRHYCESVTLARLMDAARSLPENLGPRAVPAQWPLQNVWAGTSVENQKRADECIPELLATTAALRFISVEPMLGPISLASSLGGTLWIGGQRGCGGTHRGVGTPDCPRELHHHHDERCGRGLDWVICGGESGPGARPMHPDWPRSLRDQCMAAGVPFFFKQNGEFASVSEVEGPGAHYHFPDGATVRRVGKKAAGRLLDGREWNGFPGNSGGA